jgi:hypothetical protein
MDGMTTVSLHHVDCDNDMARLQWKKHRDDGWCWLFFLFAAPSSSWNWQITTVVAAARKCNYLPVKVSYIHCHSCTSLLTSIFSVTQRVCEEIVQGREEEIRGINGRMRQVNETYKKYCTCCRESAGTNWPCWNTNGGHIVKANEKVWVSCVILWQFSRNVNGGVYQQRKCQKGTCACLLEWMRKRELRVYFCVNFLEMQMEESKENVKKGLAHVVKVNDRSGILFVHSLQIGIWCSDGWLRNDFIYMTLDPYQP